MTDDLAALLAAAQRKGIDSQFRAWIQRQPSALSGRFSEYLESGEGRSIACHIRRARNSGTAFKPAYCAIPMTFFEHADQHPSEAYCLEKYLGGTWTVDQAKSWFEAKGEEYLRLWLAS